MALLRVIQCSALPYYYHNGSDRRTRFTMEPDMLAMSTIEPAVPVSTITFAAAWALKKTPLQFTLEERESLVITLSSSAALTHSITRRHSSAGNSVQGMAAPAHAQIVSVRKRIAS